MRLWRLQTMPLKMSVLINQVFSLSSVEVEVEVESPQHLTRSPRGPSPLSSSQDAGAPLSDRMLWRQKAEDLLWLASAFFILYYGDFRSNFFSLLVNDSRIWRAPLHIGSACIISDIFLLFYLAVRFQEKLDLIAAASAIQAATVVGLAAFILLCIALWPIWTILTVPMLFTLFMALVVLVTYLLPYIDIKMDQESLHYLCIRSSL